MNKDFHDMLCALKNAKVEFLVVGAYAMGAHGVVRATLDFDIWIRASKENAQRVWSALIEFGAPMSQVHRKDFETPGIVFQVGVAPNRIDLLTFLSGLNFDQAWPNRLEAEVFGVAVPVIGRSELITNKQATGRPKDQIDADDLQKHRHR